MVRILVRIFIAVVAAAVALIIANLLLDGVHLKAGSFFGAVAIFAIAYALLTPFLISQFRRGQRGSAFLGGVSLIATLAALIITDLFSDGLNIHGVGTWLAATLIVWLGTLGATFLLPYFGLKKYLDEKRD